MIYGGCNCGNCHITILSTGDVYACRRVAGSKVGNVFTDRLADMWVCEMERYRDYDRFKKCGRCELKAWNIPENDIARCFVTLGYGRGIYPAPKARKAHRGQIIE